MYLVLGTIYLATGVNCFAIRRHNKHHVFNLDSIVQPDRQAAPPHFLLFFELYAFRRKRAVRLFVVPRVGITKKELAAMHLYFSLEPFLQLLVVFLFYVHIHVFVGIAVCLFFVIRLLFVIRGRFCLENLREDLKSDSRSASRFSDKTPFTAPKRPPRTKPSSS